MSITAELTSLFKEYDSNVEQNKIAIVECIKEKFDFFRDFFFDNKESIVDGLNAFDILYDFANKYRIETGKELKYNLNPKFGLYEFDSEKNSFSINYPSVYATVPSTGEKIKVVPCIVITHETATTRLVVYREGSHRITNYRDIDKMEYNNEELCTIVECLEKMIGKFNDIKQDSQFKSVSDELNNILNGIKEQLK